MRRNSYVSHKHLLSPPSGVYVAMVTSVPFEMPPSIRPGEMGAKFIFCRGLSDPSMTLAIARYATSQMTYAFRQPHLYCLVLCLLASRSLIQNWISVLPARGCFYTRKFPGIRYFGRSCDAANQINVGCVQPPNSVIYRDIKFEACRCINVEF